MQTALADFIRDTAEGREADRILRACVHCGFCTATCPTYQLLGDELDGPRGRIYQIKQVLEGADASPRVQGHLDRCLTCLSCESTCPSGVEYGRLLDIGRDLLERRLRRPLSERVARRLLRLIVPERRRFAALMGLARLARPFLGKTLQEKIPPRQHPGETPSATSHQRRMLLLDGCVQPALAPQINAAAMRVLDRLGVALETVSEAGCCGALCHHLSDEEGARRQARRNIDAWWPRIKGGAEAVVSGSSACALMLKDYGRLLADDPQYAVKAQTVAEMTRDLSEVLVQEDLSSLPRPAGLPRRVAFHAPCTLQHGQRLKGVVEKLLGDWGVDLVPVADPHICCGSAGSYSLLQPAISSALRERKLAALQAEQPAVIATANIGCLNHLSGGSETPVVHWIELLDRP
jgi:glycolate oxidase iron-sulfur subunit